MGFSQGNHLWYLPPTGKKSNLRVHYDAKDLKSINRSIGLMLEYCGPLSSDDICKGLNHSLYRTSYFAPHPDVMNIVLINLGYQWNNGLLILKKIK